MQNWTNLPTDGKRLNRIIRMLEKRMKKENDSDKISRLASVIGILTEKKVNIAKLHLGIKDTLDWLRIIDDNRTRY